MRLTQRIIRGAIVAGVGFASALAASLPWNAGVTIGAWLGGLAFDLLPGARRRALAHLALAFGSEQGETERRAVAHGSFSNLGRSALELLMLSRRSPSRILGLCRMDGEDRLKTAFAPGRGVIFLTGHLGNWELMAASVALKGYPSWVVATPVYDPRLDARLVAARTRHGVHTISRGSASAARQILSCLRRNAILGILIDQDTDVDGVFVPFFGRPAHTPSGAAALALKTGAAVVFGFIVRESPVRHRIVIEGPVDLIRTGDQTRDVYENTAMFTREIERYVRTYPDQWVWMHNRWKRQPAGPSRDPLPSASLAGSAP